MSKYYFKLTLIFLFLFLYMLALSCNVKEKPKVSEYDNTASSYLSPTIVSTTPDNGAASVPINTKIAATFNKEINANTINSTTFLLYNGSTPENGNYTYKDKTATFKPSADLANYTKYTAKITTGVMDSTGKSMLNNYTWSFTTGSTITQQNILWTWGNNSNGQLGDNTTSNKSTPIQVPDLADIVAIAGGGVYATSPDSYLSHSLALKNDGTVLTWGNNDFGQLGDGTTAERHNPVQVSGLTGITAIAGGGWHSIALKNDSTVWAWGSNDYGQLGDGTKEDKSTPVQVLGLTGVTAIAVGKRYNIILKNDGTVWAWGSNVSGQLGDGTTTDRSTPVQVSGLTEVIAIAGGGWHSIALKKNGTVWLWGYNKEGQLGDGTTTDRSTPVQVSGLTEVIAITGGGWHSMALKKNGTVWSWGYNEQGQLGDGTTTDRSTPVQVSGLTDVTAIAGGGWHSIALKNNTTVWAWGSNSSGRLGDGTTTDRLSPVQVTGLTGATTIAAGNWHSMALKNSLSPIAPLNVAAKSGDGQVIITWKSVPSATSYNIYWGTASGVTNINGKKISGVTSPYTHIGLTNGTKYYYVVTAINSNGESIESNQVSAVPILISTNMLWTWGDNSNGQLGDNTTTIRKTPIQVFDLTKIIAIAGGGVKTTNPDASASHSIALNNDGTVWTWGNNYYGQLGDGSITERHSPVQVSGLTGITAIGGGGRHSIALKKDGTVWAWGNNDFGQLGYDTTIKEKRTPTQVSVLTGIASIAGGSWHSMALKNDSTVWTWGNNDFGQAGYDTTIKVNSTPVKVSGLIGVKAIAGGAWHSIVLKHDGTVWTWGNNSYGQLGNNTTIGSYTPVQVSGLTGVIAIAAGGWHNLALKSDSTVWAWGYNNVGRLGDGTTTDRYTPVQVPGLTGVKAIVCGSWHSAALKSNGTVWAWGDNSYYQLGNGSAVLKSSTPVQVSDLTEITNIAAGGWHNLALKNNLPPMPPMNVIAKAGDSNVSISWNNVSDAASYNICWSKTSGVSINSSNFIGVTNPYSHTSLTNGTKYYYAVTAVNGNGESDLSDEVSATPKNDNIPANNTVINFINSGVSTANSTTVTLNISATDNVGVIGYYVSESSLKPTSSASGWVTITSTASYSNNVSFTLSSGSGSKTVYVW
ncbi:MAG: Ig-like domain-containing protein, partial [Candidatus Firestonebacteria bacterium]|nr:Ig-like domain-containing protein [Candidatus Firestonebacteria bacterium]